MTSVPFVANKSYKLCKDCRHFRPPIDNMSIKYGHCGKKGEINLVDGSIVRMDVCLEKWWEPRK